MKPNIFHCLLLLFSCLVGISHATSQPYFRWDSLPNIPVAPGEDKQYGLAGAFVGLHENVLILAGGANFPEAPPWEGGMKKWWKDIYVLQKKEGETYEWVIAGQLPLPAAYGVSIETDRGLVCIGGNQSKDILDKVWILSWDVKQQRITQDTLPSLPYPLANMAGAKIGEKIFIAGGESKQGPGKHFLELDLSSPETVQKGWKELPAWPGPQRTHCMAVSQSDGVQTCLYLMGGRYARKDSVSKLMSDAYKYDPTSHTWSTLPPISDEHGNEYTLSAAPAISLGTSHVLILGGAEGNKLNELEEMGASIASSSSETVRDSLIAIEREMLIQHQGFSQHIFAYHTITNTWVLLDKLPENSQVTTTAVRWGDDIVIPSGEISPGVRTPEMLVLSPSKDAHFGLTNYIVLGLYLSILVGLGVWFARKQTSIQDFFKAGNRIPWWAAGISIFATQLSAITFMAVPAKTYLTDWTYFVLIMTILLAAPFIIRFFLPFFRRLDITTAYEYLEKRFNLATRITGSLLYLAFQLGRLGIILLLPALALSVVTGLDVYLCVFLMGGLSILYTVLGGIEAVIWTDVLQTFVLLGGAIIVLIYIPFHVEGGISSAIDLALDANKLRLWDLTWDLSTPTIWVIVIGGFTGNVIQYGSDQTVVQRYLTTKDEQSAANSIRLGAWMAFPSAFIFVSLGTALYVFFHSNPKALPISLENPDAIFPWFIATQLPVGVSGILIAAIFAAAMSSLDSSMNSVASVITTDYYKRLFVPKSETHYLNFARIVTLIAGICGTLLALYMARGGVTSLWDQFNLIVGLFAGGLGGIFVLGIFSREAHGLGAMMGLILSGGIQYVISQFTETHLLLYSTTGFVSACIFGWVFSKLIPGKTKDLKGLTYYTLKS